MSVCSICSDERVLQINALILKGGMIRAIARRFKVSEQILSRHRRRHLRFGGVRATLPTTIAEKLQVLHEDAARLQAIAEAGGVTHAALQILKTRLALFELECKLSGKLLPDSNGTTTVNVNTGTSTPGASQDDADQIIRDYLEIHGIPLHLLPQAPEAPIEIAPPPGDDDEKPV